VSSSVRVAYVLRSWPRLSQTFVLNEILALEKVGVHISILAMTRAVEPLVQPRVADVAAPVHYLDDPGRHSGRAHLRQAAASPRRYLATLGFALTKRELFGGYTRSGAVQAFAAAVLVADRLRARSRERPFTHIHAHFAHDPALIGLLAHRLTGLPFSFTAHARDLYQIPDVALVARVREASTVVTCCQSNAEHIAGIVGETRPIELIYHGVDLGLFRPTAGPRDTAEPLIVSVGRMVEKKGFDDLLRACAHLAASKRKFKCEIYGDGPGRKVLEALRDDLGLADHVTFCGSRTQAQLLAVYQRADVFALTPRLTDDGDRDGVPNVLVEAMACGIPVVSTRIGGIPEVVISGTDGLLAQQRDAGGIASCLAELLDDARRRQRLGDAAAHTVTRFDTHSAALRLAALFSHSGGAAS
jgi:glycosyltransferase involved in cell wall biosynthesis